MNHFKPEPAMILYSLNALIAMLVSFGLPLSADMVGAITVIATAVLTIWTAATTSPIVVSSITGAVGTLLAAVAAFGFSLDANQIGSVVTVLSIVLALLLRQNVSPSPALAARR
jgi:hypothetical protein